MAFKVYQCGELIGYLNSTAIRSKSSIYDVRPGDFTRREENGAPVFDAASNICPGDFDCIEGFRRADGSEPDTEVADSFDDFFKIFARAKERGSR